MKSKILALGLVSALGMVAANAQVTSVNAVGYINLKIPPGFSMISNQLLTEPGKSTIGDLFPNPDVGTQIFLFNNSGGNFSTFEFVDLGGGVTVWFPNSSAELKPGGGAFIRNPGTISPGVGDLDITFVGEVPTGSASNIPVIPAGFSIISNPVPQDGKLDTELGYDPEVGDQIFKFNNAPGTYSTFEFVDLGGGVQVWFPSEPSTVVGEAFFIRSLDGNNWTRDFTL